MPAVSVITPVYNKQAYVGATIESVLVQSVSSWEMIVVDDGSTDESMAKVQAFDDPRVRILRLSKRGPGACRNAGVREATGEWVQFLDADDLLEPDHLARQLADAVRQPDADVLACRWQEFEDGNPHTRRLKEPVGLSGPPSALRDSTVGSAPWAVHAAILRRGHLSDERLWPEDLDRYLGEDIAFWFRLVSTSEVAYGSSEGAVYRVNAPDCRTRADDAEKWFTGVHAAIQSNLDFLERKRRSITPGQCGHLMRVYSGMYLLAREKSVRDVASQALSLSSYWLRRYFRAGGNRDLAMLSRRMLGLKLFLSMRGRRAALAG